jgi:hypothetical protein
MIGSVGCFRNQGVPFALSLRDVIRSRRCGGWGFLPSRNGTHLWRGGDRHVSCRFVRDKGACGRPGFIMPSLRSPAGSVIGSTPESLRRHRTPAVALVPGMLIWPRPASSSTCGQRSSRALRPTSCPRWAGVRTNMYAAWNPLPIEGQAHGSDQHRVRRSSEDPKSRIKCPSSRILFGAEEQS